MTKMKIRQSGAVNDATRFKVQVKGIEEGEGARAASTLPGVSWARFIERRSAA